MHVGLCMCLQPRDGAALQPTHLVNCNLHALQCADSLHLRAECITLQCARSDAMNSDRKVAASVSSTRSGDPRQHYKSHAVCLALAYRCIVCMMLFARCL